jgi:hypothetical protein
MTQEKEVLILWRQMIDGIMRDRAGKDGIPRRLPSLRDACFAYAAEGNRKGLSLIDYVTGLEADTAVDLLWLSERK